MSSYTDQVCEAVVSIGPSNGRGVEKETFLSQKYKF